MNEIVQAKDVQIGDVYEDCFYHPMRCTFIDLDSDDICGESLLDQSTRSCSVKHCGVYKPSQQRIDLIIETYNTAGIEGLLRLNNWSEELIRRFKKGWCSND